MNEKSAPEDEREDEEHPRLRSRLEGLVRDVVRRTVTQGVGAALQTEESLRQAVTDLKLPKEAVSYILQQVDTTKKELVRVAAKEFREFLESANLGEEIARILTTLSFEIRTEVRFIPNDQKVRPSVSSTMRLRNNESGQTVSEDSAPGIFEDAIRDAATELASSLLRRGGRAEAEEDVEADDEERDAAGSAASRARSAVGAGRAASVKGSGAGSAAKRSDAAAGEGESSGKAGADTRSAEKSDAGSGSAARSGVTKSSGGTKASAASSRRKRTPRKKAADKSED